MDFNKYGIKDNIGLLAVSDVFCDCFILELNNKKEEDQYVNLLKAGITCIDEGHQNFMLWLWHSADNGIS